MAGFNPKGVSLPQLFRKNQTNNSTYKQTPKDRLAEVISVETDIGDNGKLMIVEHNEEGPRRYQVTIANSTRERLKNDPNSKNPTRKWSGGCIDEKFAKEITAGTMIILERCLSTGPKKTVNGEDIYFIETNWIRKAPMKAFPGIFTISSFRGRVSSVQSWEKKAISFDDTEKLSALADELDSLLEKRNNGEFLPSIGVQMYAMLPDQRDADGKIIDYVVVDTTPPFDWQSGEQNPDGTTAKGHPLSGDKLEQLIQGYQDYLLGNEEEGIPAKFDAETQKDLKIELQQYTNYNASTISPELEIPENRQFHPLYRMSHTPSKYAMDDTGYVTNKNWAVSGILTLTNDKVETDMKTRQTIFQNRDIANRLFANGIMGNVLSFVRTADGMKKKPHNDLKVILNEDGQPGPVKPKENQPTNSNTQTSGRSGSTVTPPASTEQHEQQEDFSLMSSQSSSDFDDIPFGDDPFAKIDEATAANKADDDIPFDTETKEEKGSDSASGKRNFGGRRRDI